MTKKELSQIYYLLGEVKMWQRELAKMQCESAIKPQQITDMPRGSGTSDPTARTVTSIIHIEQIIEGKLAEIQIQRERIIKYIDGIEDSFMRQIMFYRHVSCMKWDEVAAHIGGDNTKETTRKAHDRFLESN